MCDPTLMQVWSDHDINFKKLNSQLLKEVEAYEAAHTSARTVAGIDTAYDPAAAQHQQQPPARGRTLAGAVAAGQLLNHRVLPAPELARAAALARWQEQQQQQQQLPVPLADWQASPTAAQPGIIAAAGIGTAAAAAAAGGQVVSPPLPDSSNGVPVDPDAAATAAAAAEAAVDLQAYEHEDASTAAAEAAADRLGSLQPGDDADWEPGLQLAGMGLEQPGMQQGPASLQPQQDTMVMDEQQQDEQLQQQQTQWQQQQQPMVGISKGADGPVPAADAAAAEPEAVGCSCCREHSSCLPLQDDLQGDLEQQPAAAAAGHADPAAAAVAAAAQQAAANGLSSPPLSSATGASGEAAVPQSTAAVLPTSPQEACVVLQQQHQQPVQQQSPSESNTLQGPQSQPEAVAPSPTSTSVSWGAEDAAAFEGLDSVLLGKLQQAGQLVQQLLQQSADSGQGPALQTLAGVLANLAEHPQDGRFRRLRCSNAALHRKLGRFPAARGLLMLAGFAEQQQEVDGSGYAEPVLVWVRRDVGLVWLVLSVVREALQSIS
jgi:hypothetical protein